MKHQIIQTNVSRETITQVETIFDQYQGKILDYADLLLWWNKKINLVSRSLQTDELLLHIKHCLFLHSLIEKETRLIDAGCGGGLPGIPLAMVSPDKNFHLIDKVQKKILSVNDMLRRLHQTNVKASSIDLSKFNTDEPISIISKHAFKLKDLIHYTNRLKPTAYFILKGQDFFREIEEVNQTLKIHAIDLSNVDSFYQDKFMLDIRIND